MLALACLFAPLILNQINLADAVGINGFPVIVSVFVANPPDTQFGVTYFGDDTGPVGVTVTLPGELNIAQGERVVVVGRIRVILHKPDGRFSGFLEIRLDGWKILRAIAG